MGLRDSCNISTPLGIKLPHVQKIFKSICPPRMTAWQGRYTSASRNHITCISLSSPHFHLEPSPANSLGNQILCLQLWGACPLLEVKMPPFSFLIAQLESHCFTLGFFWLFLRCWVRPLLPDLEAPWEQRLLLLSNTKGVSLPTKLICSPWSRLTDRPMMNVAWPMCSWLKM